MKSFYVFLNIIRQASIKGKWKCTFKNFKLNNSLLIILVKHGLIYMYKKSGMKLVVYLKPKVCLYIFKSIRFYSKPSRFMYVSYNVLASFNKLNSLVLVSTNRGLLVKEEALYYKVGGYLLLITFL